MDILMFVFQISTLLLVIFLLINFLLKDNINSSLKNYFQNIQYSINRVNEKIQTEIPKITTSTSYISGVLDKLDFQIKTFTSFQPINLSKIINLTDFEIYYFTPYDGYLFIEADYCEIRFLDDSQIIIKKHLKNFFLKARKTISIRNIKNLRNIYFEKK